LQTSTGGLQSILSSFYKETIQKLSLILNEKSSLITVELDLWSDPALKKGYLGATAHFLDKSYKSVKVFLGVAPLPPKHDAGVIKKYSDILLNRYGLSDKDVSRYVTDNASNMLAAFKNDIFGKSL
jgi:hypothetical protein